ncbi:MAG: hypothetical protein F4X14_03420 [Caldilineaceae bacterium SB0661_bin_32]|uniref:Uncharacterized protein n=1 Tax=Caldilineaceae bacterium SB0661_bin_32 TaxID=2605255 RepID=A0A6B1D343_9CHLR|nr:hypothetical protein [Caldilineaceae bacterium SB0661_bin_32]
MLLRGVQPKGEERVERSEECMGRREGRHKACSYRGFEVDGERRRVRGVRGMAQRGLPVTGQEGVRWI